MLKPFSKFILLWTLVCAFHGARAERADVQELEIVAKVHTTLAALYFEAAREEGGAGRDRSDFWQGYLNEAAMRVLSALEPLDSERGHFSWLKERLRGVSFERLAASIRHIARTQGAPTGAAVATGAVMDFVAPAFCFLIGYPALAPLTWLVPFEIAGYSAGYAVQQAYLKWRLIKLYGSREAYERIQGAYLRHRRELKLYGLSDLLIPLLSESGERDAVVLREKEGRWRRFFTFLGLAQERLTYSSLRRFCLRRHIAKEAIGALDSTREISELAKALLLWEQIESAGDEEISNALRERFSESFVKIAETPYFKELAPWARKFAQVGSLEDVQALMEEAPQGVPPRVIAELWKDCLLPVVIQNNDKITYRETVKLKSRFEALLVEAAQSDDTTWGAAWTAKFVSYLRELYPSLSQRSRLGESPCIRALSQLVPAAAI